MSSEIKSDIKSEFDDKERDIKLDDNNESIKYILENLTNEDADVKAMWIYHSDRLRSDVDMYLWRMKNRKDFVNNTWKNIAKRLTMMKKEGFDIRSNTKRAKKRRTAKDAKESKLEQLLKTREKADKKSKASRERT